MNNIIMTKDDDMLGYYEDLSRYFLDYSKELINNKEYDELEETLDVLKELREYEESDNLLKISNNNGMGLTIHELEVSEKTIPF